MTKAGQALERALVAWNEGRGSDYLAVYDETVKLHSGSMGEADGLERVSRMYAYVWRKYDSRIEVDDLIAEGDKVAVRYRWIATSKSGGESFTVPGLSVLHFVGERCTERWDLEFKAES